MKALETTPAWLAKETESDRAKVAELQKIRRKATDWKNAHLKFQSNPLSENFGEWYAVPARSHESIRKAKRDVLHLRKDGWIHPDERADVAEKVIRHTLRKIEARSNVKISGESAKTESARFSGKDARAAAMLALTETGFFHHGRMSLSTFREIRNQIQGKACFRLRCKWEESSDDITQAAASAGFMTEFEEVSHRLTLAQKSMAREIMRTLRASLACDQSRKAAASFKSQRDFFLLVLGCLTGRASRAMSAGSFDVRKSRFLDYLAKGAEHLRATRQPAPTLADEIMSALAGRALA